MRKAGGNSIDVTLVGPGRLGSALARNLAEAGYPIKLLAVGSRSGHRQAAATLARTVGAKVVTLGKAPLDTHLVWITVPDDALESVAAGLARTQHWTGKTVFHSSGALTSNVLLPLKERGATVASVHPGMTFVGKLASRLEGVPFGVEGDAAAVRLAKRIVSDLGGTSYSILRRNKVLYHAFGSFASPMVIALMAAMEQVGKAAGIRPEDLRTMAAPLLRQTLSNYLEHGASAALSGPLVRGDVETIRKHLAELQRTPEARDVYVALTRVATRHLPVKKRKTVARELATNR